MIPPAGMCRDSWEWGNDITQIVAMAYLYRLDVSAKRTEMSTSEGDPREENESSSATKAPFAVFI